MNEPVCGCHGEPWYTYLRDGRVRRECRVSRTDRLRRFRATEKRRVAQQQDNSTAAARLRKQLWEMSNVRFRY